MRFNINGFDQVTLVNMKLNNNDSLILRWFVDFHSTDKMVTIIDANGEIYKWVKYQAVIDDLPVLNINNREVIARHFDKMVKAGIMAKFLLKKGGTYTCFRLTEKYRELLEHHDSIVKTNAPWSVPDCKVDPSDHSKVDPLTDCKVDPKDSSIKLNNSIKLNSFVANSTNLPINPFEKKNTKKHLQKDKAIDVKSDIDKLRPTFVNETSILKEYQLAVKQKHEKMDEHILLKIDSMCRKDPGFKAFFEVAETIRAANFKMYSTLSNTFSAYHGKVQSYIQRLVDAEIDVKEYTLWFLEIPNKSFGGFSWKYFCGESFVWDFVQQKQKSVASNKMPKFFDPVYYGTLDGDDQAQYAYKVECTKKIEEWNKQHRPKRRDYKEQYAR